MGGSPDPTMDTPDTLSCISTLLAVVRHGSFTQAGLQLGLTTSAVGKRMARLERHLGLPLFQRGGRRLRLTPDGQTYHDTCADALERIAATEAALSPRSPRALRGRVRIDLPVAFGRRVVLPLLLDGVREHPELMLSLSFHDATVDLGREEVDIALRFGSPGDSSHLVARHISRQTRQICASPAYLRDHGVPQQPEDLHRHRCIVGTVQGPPIRWVLRDAPLGGRASGTREDAAQRLLTPPASHQFNDGEAIIDAAVAGFGLCQMPSSLLRQPIARGELVPVLEEWTGTPVDVHLMWNQKATLAARVRHVVDLLVAAGERGALD
jgi:DNA-binding transcriptional LysR family regulator